MLLDELLGKGKLEKMSIQAYKPPLTGREARKNPGLSKEDEDKYMVQVNPEGYQVNMRLRYSNQQAMGNPGNEAKYLLTTPSNLDFKFLFDGTGVVPKPAGPLDNVPIAGAIAGLLSGDKPYDVLAELEKFLHVVYDYQGKQHRPRIVQIAWGTLLFDGALTSLNINYKLFKPDGTPLRAEAQASFRQHMWPKDMEEKKGNESPDLTHLRKVQAGDTLPIMAQRIYGDPAHYLEVARANKLVNFRNLKPGQEIFFPPIKK